MRKIFLLVLSSLAIVFFAAFAPANLGTTPKTSFLNSAFSLKTNTVTAYAATIQYGLIGEGAILLDEDFEAVTGLPATYFVIIISETESYYNVQYSDLTGFVNKNKIVPIDYEPKLVFGMAYFIASNDTHPVNVRSSPKSDAEIIATVADGESSFYYGAITGDALIPAAGGLWYYVRINSDQRGYVYSAQGTAGVFPVNSGERAEAPPSNIDGEGSGGGGGASFPDWGFILLLAIPAVIITLTLFARKPVKEDKNPQ